MKNRTRKEIIETRKKSDYTKDNENSKKEKKMKGYNSTRHVGYMSVLALY